MCMCIFVYTCKRMHTCECVCLCMCVCMHRYVYVHVCMHVCQCLCMLAQQMNGQVWMGWMGQAGRYTFYERNQLQRIWPFLLFLTHDFFHKSCYLWGSDEDRKFMVLEFEEKRSQFPFSFNYKNNIISQQPLLIHVCREQLQNCSKTAPSIRSSHLVQVSVLF